MLYTTGADISERKGSAVPTAHQTFTRLAHWPRISQALSLNQYST